MLAAPVAALALAGQATADPAPSTIIVPFAAGGPDAMARILGERMKTTPDEPLVISNVIGAGGPIGVGRAVRAAPEGCAISFGHFGTPVANGAIDKPCCDLVADLEPVVLPQQPHDLRQLRQGCRQGRSRSGWPGWAKSSAGQCRHRRRAMGSHIAGLRTPPA